MCGCSHGVYSYSFISVLDVFIFKLNFFFVIIFKLNFYLTIYYYYLTTRFIIKSFCLFFCISSKNDEARMMSEKARKIEQNFFYRKFKKIYIFFVQVEKEKRNRNKVIEQKVERAKKAEGGRRRRKMKLSNAMRFNFKIFFSVCRVFFLLANLDDHKMRTTGQHDGNISYHNQQYTIAKLTNQRQQNNCLNLRMFDNVLIVQHEAAKLKLKEA